ASARSPEPNYLRFRLGSDDGITLHLQAKAPGDELTTKAVDLDVHYEEALGHRTGPYQRLLEDAMEGDRRRFGRADSLLEQWRIVAAGVGAPPPARPCYPGTWGTAEADRLAADVGGWREPLAPA